MIVTVGDQRYRVVFKYTHFPSPEKHVRLNGKEAEIKAQTECHILPIGEDGKVIETQLGGHGYSWCSVEDNFEKAPARETAFRRATDDFVREIRGPILNAYYTKRRG